MVTNKKEALIDDLLRETVTIIEQRDNMYFPTNFSLNDIVLKTKSFRTFASKIIDTIITKRQANGIKKSVFNDKLFKDLMDGKTIIWSDITGVVPEKKYEDEIKKMAEVEEKISDSLKEDLITSILKKLSIKNELIDGYFFSTNKDAILLPILVKNAKYFETEDIYDCFGIEIIDNIKDFFICISNNGVVINIEDNDSNYVGSLVSKDNVNLMSIKRINNGLNKEFIGELLISEDQINEQ